MEENINNQNYESQKVVTNEDKKKDSKIVEIEISRTIASHKSCIICKPHNIHQKLRQIPIEAIIDTYIQRDILIPEGCRCCSCHLNENDLLNEESLDKLIAFSDTSKFNPTHLKNVLESFKLLAKKNNLFSKFKEMQTITNDMCVRNTGFDREQFGFIADCLCSMRDSDKRSKLQALAVYLFWLKTGLSQEMIATHFDTITQIDVSRFCQQSRDALTRDFVVKYIGSNIKTREECLKHNSYIAKELFDLSDSQFIIICDGTYCYIQKSLNNFFQRISYSVQKSRSLVKPFVICAADGFIIDIYGFYEATKNDSTILKEIINNDPYLMKLISPGKFL